MKNYLFLVLMACTNTEKTQNAAVNWANTLYPGQHATVLCDTMDSDNDGRVRCSVVVPNLQPISIDCPSTWLPNTSSNCVLTKSMK